MNTKIAIVGSGAIGIFYGAKLQEGGAEVHFLMRSGLEEARMDGIRVLSPDGDLHLRHPRCSALPEQIPPVDWVVIGLKATANSDLPRLVTPLLHPGTSLLCLQNGIGHEEALAETFPGHPIVAGLCFVCLNRPSPASVRHSKHGTILLAQFAQPMQAATKGLLSLFQKGGVEVRTAEHVAAARWQKLMWNIPFNGLTIVSGEVGVDQILGDKELSHRCLLLMEEVRRTATALGFPLPSSLPAELMEKTREMGDYRPSSLEDFCAGREVEIEAIWGAPLRFAEKNGIAMPHLHQLYDQLRRHTASQTNRRI